MEVPETWVRSTIICACKSVAKPGKGSVETSAPPSAAGAATRARPRRGAAARRAGRPRRGPPAARGRPAAPRPHTGGARGGLDLHAHPPQLVELHLEVRG